MANELIKTIGKRVSKNLVENVKIRLTELEVEKTKLFNILDVFSNSGQSLKRRKPRSKVSARRKKSRVKQNTRKTKKLTKKAHKPGQNGMYNKVVAYLKDNPGSSLQDISKAMKGHTYGQVTSCITYLKKRKRINIVSRARPFKYNAN
jgi:hypothetical protein